MAADLFPNFDAFEPIDFQEGTERGGMIME
jgi:hypothetical protein